MLPALVGEIRAFVDALPRYLARIQTLAADANHPWVRKIIGHELSFDQPSTPIISGAGGHWFGDVLSSLWSGGNALLSLVSLLVVAPIVAISPSTAMRFERWGGRSMTPLQASCAVRQSYASFWVCSTPPS